PHLREAVWRNLSEAEGRLRAGESIACEEIDFDLDGQRELWIHSGDFSAIVSPHRGGAIEELTRFGTGINYADVLTRRLEAYHLAALQPAATDGHEAGGGAATIHEIERGLRLAEAPPVDRHDRALLRERILPSGLDLESYSRANYTAVRSWEAMALEPTVTLEADAVTVELTAADGSLTKTLRFATDGTVNIGYRWDPALGGAEDLF